jgi:hypothetical protein
MASPLSHDSDRLPNLSGKHGTRSDGGYRDQMASYHPNGFGPDAGPSDYYRRSRASPSKLDDLPQVVQLSNLDVAPELSSAHYDGDASTKDSAPMPSTFDTGNGPANSDRDSVDVVEYENRIHSLIDPDPVRQNGHDPPSPPVNDSYDAQRSATTVHSTPASLQDGSVNEVQHQAIGDSFGEEEFGGLASPYKVRKYCGCHLGTDSSERYSSSALAFHPFPPAANTSSVPWRCKAAAIPSSFGITSTITW